MSSSHRDKSRSRHDSGDEASSHRRDRSSVRRESSHVRESSRDREKRKEKEKEKTHRKRDTLTVDAAYGRGGSTPGSPTASGDERESKRNRPRSKSKVRKEGAGEGEPEVLDRSFVSPGGGAYKPLPIYQYAGTPALGYDTGPTSPYGGAGGHYPDQPYVSNPQAYAPSPSTYLPPVAPPKPSASSASSAQYEYHIPPAPTPPSASAYPPPPPPLATPLHSQTGAAPVHPQHGAVPLHPQPVAVPLHPQPGSTHTPHTPPPPPPQQPYGGGSSGNSLKPSGGSGAYTAAVPPPLPPPSPGLGPHAYPPPSPNLGPHYTASPAYSQPTQYGGAYPPPSPHHRPTHSSGAAGGSGHGHSHSHSQSLAIPGMSNLSLGGASPALQPYHGTYQSISPMPSPLMIATNPSDAYGGYHHHPSHSPHSSISEFSPINLGAPLIPSMASPSHSSHPTSIPLSPPVRPPTPPYDPALHAKALLASLSSSKVDPAPINQILPTLHPKHLLALRAEYKRLFHQVNLSKHIKLQLPPTTSSPWARIVWVTSLGQYESEGWWANCWYQREGVRRELLVEALVGKRPEEVRWIKKAFRDGRVGNSLDRAVKEEVGTSGSFGRLMDLVLDVDNTDNSKPRREEETEEEMEGVLGSVHGHIVNVPGGVKMDKVQSDVRTLAEILLSDDDDDKEGPKRTHRMGHHGSYGRSSSRVSSSQLNQLVKIILCPTTPHLREVIRWFRQLHGKDLAKTVLGYSPTLVGEALVHRLAGIIDKPLRDAKLLEDALGGMLLETGGGGGGRGRDAKGGGAEDLFISRLVRVHWEKQHLSRVKRAYAKKFRGELVDRVKEVCGTLGKEEAKGGVGGRNFREFVVRMIDG